VLNFTLGKSADCHPLVKLLAFLEVPECQECILLRRKYADAALTHAELRGELRKAVQDGKGELVTILLVSEAAAFKDRNAAEATYEEHRRIAHGGGEATGESA